MGVEPQGPPPTYPRRSLMVRAEGLKLLIEKFGGSYSRLLGLEPLSGERQLFQWFLASILFGAPISEKAAMKTFRLFQAEGLDAPKKILKAGWDRLVELLDAGGYTRYDFKTADKLLEMAGNLEKLYGGSLLKLHEEAENAVDLENRLMKLAKGIGPTTVSIFLREAWEALPKAEPLPSAYEILAASNLNIFTLKSRDRAALKKALARLVEVWEKAGKPRTLADFRAALLRLGRDYCRKHRCSQCPVKAFCRVGLGHL